MRYVHIYVEALVPAGYSDIVWGVCLCTHYLMFKDLLFITLQHHLCQHWIKQGDLLYLLSEVCICETGKAEKSHSLAHFTTGSFPIQEHKQ